MAGDSPRAQWGSGNYNASSTMQSNGTPRAQTPSGRRTFTGTQFVAPAASFAQQKYRPSSAQHQRPGAFENRSLETANPSYNQNLYSTQPSPKNPHTMVGFRARPSTAGGARSTHTQGYRQGEESLAVSSNAPHIEMPFLPGQYVTHDFVKNQKPRRQGFQVRNGVHYEREEEPVAKGAMAVSPDVNRSDVTADYDRWGTSTATAFRGWQQLDTTSSSFVPQFVEKDRQVLRFFGYFKEQVHENAVENWRARRLVLHFYLVDGSIHIEEPRQLNSGLPQGVFLKRQRIRNPDGEGDYSIEDFGIGANLNVYGKVIHIVDMDANTRAYFEASGVPTGEPEPYPEDTHEQMLLTNNKLFQARSNPESVSFGIKSMNSRHPRDIRSLLENDRKVLRFGATWHVPFVPGMKWTEKFNLLFYLADGTIEIDDLVLPNQGKKPGKFLNRNKLPKVPKLDRNIDAVGQQVQDCYTEQDLFVGSTINVFGRKMLLTSCDPYTQNFYLEKYNYDQNANKPPATARPALADKVPAPAWSKDHLYGGPEDSLRNFDCLSPVAPKADRARFDEHGNSILRFAAKMVNAGPADVNRQFVATFFCVDDTIAVYEPPIRNSGQNGGRFIERRRIINPFKPYINGNPQCYRAEDFYSGAEVELEGYVFLLQDEDERSQNLRTSCDLTTLKRATEIVDEDVDFVDKMVRRKCLEALMPPRPLFEKFKVEHTSFIDSAAFGRMLRFFEVQLPTDKCAYIFKRWDVNNDGKIDFNEFNQAIRFFVPAVRALIPGADAVFDKLRKRLKENGSSVTDVRMELKRLASLDGDVTRTQVQDTLRMFGGVLEKEEYHCLFDAFDKNKIGTLSVSSFINGLRGSFSDRRREVVRAAFDNVDVYRNNRLSVDELGSVYDAYSNPAVDRGTMDTDQAWAEVCEGLQPSRDRMVGRVEFEDYYKDVSALIEDEEEFVQLVATAWGLSPSSPSHARARQREQNARARSAAMRPPVRSNPLDKWREVSPVKYSHQMKSVPAAYRTKSRPF
eukprot:GILJ01002753.1.p1 GENE.GILJ01002753.1~~GILJ01002753.1.p1  ORF type:complete len:1046 (+),score=158.87 GILJ01002753.1:79-3138(+)